MRAIVRRQDGDTDMSDSDYTDWDAADAFGTDLVALAHHQPSATASSPVGDRAVPL